MSKRIAIIGAGISGLSTALRLRELDPKSEITIFDSRERAGGVLATEQAGDYLIETSADMFATTPDDALRLFKKVGLGGELVATRDIQQRAFIAFEEKLHAVPDGFSLMKPGQLWPVLQSSLLTWSGKQRLLEELSVPRGCLESDESLESFVTRRLGRETYERLVQPLTSGIYTADPARLSMRATMARFLEMEQTYGSLVRAGLDSPATDRTASGARYNLFRGPARGFGSLVDTLVDRLKQFSVNIELNCQVTGLGKDDSNWSLSTGSSHESSCFDGVVLSTAARVSSPLCQSFAPELATELARIETASVAIVAIGADRSQFKNDFGGFGILYPSCEEKDLIAISFSSNKFPGRAPDSKLLIRCFIGGALQAGLLERNDQQLIESAIAHLSQAVGFEGDSELVRVYRWNNAMPQYHLGHLERVSKIENYVDAIPGLALAGNSYRGVGIAACVASGKHAAEKLLR